MNSPQQKRIISDATCRSGCLWLCIFSMLMTLSFSDTFAQTQGSRSQGSAQQNTSSQEIIDRMVFDFYVANKFIGTAIGSFTDEWIELDSPEDIIQQIDGLKTPAQVERLLRGRISSSQPKETGGVGRVEAQPKFFRVNLALAPEQVKISRLETSNINLPENNLSLTHRMKINTSSDFDTRTADRSSLNHATTLSQGAWRSKLSGTLVKSQGYDLNTFNVMHDVGTASYQAGMLTTPGLRFASGQSIWGVGVQTNTRLLKGQNVIRSSPIEIYIPSRAKVQMFRKGTQLIYSEVLDFGLQEIDTSTFPDGSYEIEIVITEYSGDVTREVRQFSKSGNILAGNQPIYGFTAGIKRSSLDLVDGYSMQGSVRWKWNDTNELSSSLLLDENNTIFEQALHGDYNSYGYDFSAQLSAEGATAVAGRLRYDQKPWNISLNAERTLSGHIRRDGTTDETTLLARASELYSASINYTANAVNYQFNAQRSDTKASEEPTFSYGPTVSWNAYSQKGHNLRFAYSHVRSNTGINASLMANYRFDITDDWRSESSAARRRSGSKDRIELAQKFNYHKNYGITSVNGYAARNYSMGENDYNTDSGSLGYDGKAVKWALAGQRNELGGNQKTRTSVDFTAETNLVYSKKKDTEESSLELDSKAHGESTFIAKIEGDATDMNMRVMINKRPRGVVKVGETLSISLAPYKTYEVALVPDNDLGLVQFDNQVEKFTIYPGNIVQKTWKVKKSLLVIGRLVDLKGDAISWKPIKGLNGLTATDGAGNFQLELAGNEMPFIQTRDTQCTFSMPQIKTENYFLHIGDILCL